MANRVRRQVGRVLARASRNKRQPRLRPGFARTLLAFGLLLASGACLTAQPVKKVPTIGYLDLADKQTPAQALAAFADELRQLGYVRDRDYVFLDEYADGDKSRLPILARKLVEAGADVLVAFGTQASQSAKDAAEGTKTRVVISSSDPIGAKLVDSLSRPGGNVTGLTSAAPKAAQKRVELLTHLLPDLSSVAVLLDAENPGDKAELDESQAAADDLHITLVQLDVGSASAVPGAFSQAVTAGAQGLVVFSSSTLNPLAPQIAQCAARYRLPVVSAQPEYAAYGGLISYGPDFESRYRRAAVFVDKLLKGASPADLPIEQARLHLVVNLGAAQDIGQVVPQRFRDSVDDLLPGPLPRPAAC